jgi:hypothetical protein
VETALAESSACTETAVSSACDSAGLGLVLERRFLILWLIALPQLNCTSEAGLYATGLNRFK